MVDPNVNEEIHEAQPDTGDPNAIKYFSPLEAEIVTLAEDLREKVYDLDTGKGLDEAKRDRTRWVKIRTGIDKLRKAAKAEFIKRGKRVDAEARRLTAISQPHEDNLNEKINAKLEEKARAKAERERLAAEERERQEKAEQKEAARQSRINQELNEIDKPLPYGSTLVQAMGRREWLAARTATEEEFGDRLQEVKDALQAARGVIAVIVADMEKTAQEKRELAELRDREIQEQLRRDAERGAAEEAAKAVKAAAEQEPKGEPAAATATTPAPSPETTEPAGETAKAVDGTMGSGAETNDAGDGTLVSRLESAIADGDFPSVVELVDDETGQNLLEHAVTDEFGNSPEQARALAAAQKLNRQDLPRRAVAGDALLGTDVVAPETKWVDGDKHTGSQIETLRDSAGVPTGAFVDAYMVLRVAAGHKWLDVPTAATTKEAALKKADILDLRPHKDQRPWLSRQVVMVHIKEVG